MQQDIMWSSVKGFEGYYEISSNGVLRSLDRLTNNGTKRQKQKYLKPSCRKGYLRYSLSFNGCTSLCSAHRLVAEAFIPNTDNKPFINHINGIKDDNRVDNLEWVTQLENVRHTIETLKIKWNKSGLEHGNIKSVVRKSADNYTIVKRYDLIEDAVKDGFDPSSIVRCCKNKSWYHKGYCWAYSE